MKKFLYLFYLLVFFMQPVHAWTLASFDSDEYAVKKVIKSQVKYANKTDFENFISTFDSKYINADGFNLDIYSTLVKDIWKTFNNIEYKVVIKDIEINGDRAKVNVDEFSNARIDFSEAYEGELESEANSVYYLEKIDGKWKVVSDEVLDELTTMLYGEAKGLNIRLSTPNNISPNTEYTAVLEFEPPQETIAIASLASDIVEYPQKPTKEVFRALPEDNILERLFTANNQNANEYVVASIGLTKTAVCDLNVKLSLTGFGYAIKRVNVISDNTEAKEGENVKK